MKVDKSNSMGVPEVPTPGTAKVEIGYPRDYVKQQLSDSAMNSAQ